MSKYEIRVCNCGRIHAIPGEKVTNAITKQKEILLVCGGCGSVTVIGAEYRAEGAYGLDTPCYDRYSYDLADTFSITSQFTTPKYGEIEEILFDKGIRVPMMTGEYARQFNPFVGFSDIWCPDFYPLETARTTIQDVDKFIKEYRTNRQTVDMDRLIHENNQQPEILEAISSRMIEGLDWIGTPYDHWSEKESSTSTEKTNHFVE